MFTIEHIPFQFKPRIQILALGSDTHQRISWTQKGKIFSLRPKKDFKAVADFYQEAVRFLLKRFRITPKIITYDPHPFFVCGYEAGILKERYFPKAKLAPVFHHEAHVANFGIETGLKKRFIGIAFDGTGFGQDRHIWGGEFFIYPVRDKRSKTSDGCLRQPVSNGVYDTSSFKRVAHFDEQALPGNESAIREPWRVAFSILRRIYGKKICQMKFKFLQGIPKEKLKLVAEMLDKNFNAPLTSSVGRLFDAASALLDIKPVAQKEAEAAIELEKAALKFIPPSQKIPGLHGDECEKNASAGCHWMGKPVSDAKRDNPAGSPAFRRDWRGQYRYHGHARGVSIGRCRAYPFRVHKKNGIFLVDILPTFRQMVNDMGQKKSVSEIAYRFHLTIARATLQVCGLLKKIYSINNVYCSGGVFMNSILTNELKKRMPKAGFSVYFAQRLYTTDLGISQGQIAALLMER